MTSQYNLFKKHSNSQQADSLARYLPGGELFEAAFIKESATRDLLEGLSGELVRMEQELINYVAGYGMDGNILLIPEFESQVGIPDTCFLATGDADERMAKAIAKLSANGVQTVEDFEALALSIGIAVTVIPGEDAIPAVSDPKFTIVIEHAADTTDTFPYDFPFIFRLGEVAILECFFEKLKPANCRVLFVEV